MHRKDMQCHPLLRTFPQSQVESVSDFESPADCGAKTRNGRYASNFKIRHLHFLSADSQCHEAPHEWLRLKPVDRRSTPITSLKDRRSTAGGIKRGMDDVDLNQSDPAKIDRNASTALGYIDGCAKHRRRLTLPNAMRAGAQAANMVPPLKGEETSRLSNCPVTALCGIVWDRKRAQNEREMPHTPTAPTCRIQEGLPKATSKRHF